MATLLADVVAAGSPCQSLLAVGELRHVPEASVTSAHAPPSPVARLLQGRLRGLYLLRGHVTQADQGVLEVAAHLARRLTVTADHLAAQAAARLALAAGVALLAVALPGQQVGADAEVALHPVAAVSVRGALVAPALGGRGHAGAGGTAGKGHADVVGTAVLVGGAGSSSASPHAFSGLTAKQRLQQLLAGGRYALGEGVTVPGDASPVAIAGLRAEPAGDVAEAVRRGPHVA